MPKESVSSSNLRWVDYNALKQELVIGFSRGDMYVYYGVPLWVVEELKTAPSVGAYFRDNLYYGYNRTNLGRWRTVGYGSTYERII